MKSKQALIAQALTDAAYWRKQPWLHPQAINPRWIAARFLRKARLIRRMVRG